jgi:serine/threonine protein kinase/regulator of sirC expression with transglutaminase-like and TPR domain
MPSSEQSDPSAAKTVNSSRTIKHDSGVIISQRYQIVQELGRTGWSNTYLAKDLQIVGDSRCIIEQLDPRTFIARSWQQDRQGFHRYLELLRRLAEHPQIPQFLAGLVEDGRVYLVLEYINGQRLTQIVKKQVFDEAKAIHLLHDTLRILDFVHKINLTYCDLQPCHLILSNQDQSFVLANLGSIAELTTNDQAVEETQITSNISNRDYVAPEQTTVTSNCNSNIYALGKIIVYALTGKSPGKLAKEGIVWHDDCQICLRFRAIVNKMIAANPEERYHSALEVLYDLKPLLKIERVVGGRYRITQYLGGNARINTYLAENLRRKHQSPCVLQQIDLPEGDRTDWELVERRFSEELSLLERLSYHDLISQIWDRFEENEAFYLVREHIVGETISQISAKGGKWSEKQVSELLEHILNLLVFVHQHHLLHRQIEPNNILIRYSDRMPILIDFGVLADMATALDPHNAKTNDRRKKYLAPEQLAGRPTVGSDIYALGITAIEMLTGSDAAQLTRHSETGEIVWKTPISFSRRLAKILEKMTCLDVGKRYQSAEKVIGDLKKIQVAAKPELNAVHNTATSSYSQRANGLRPMHLLVAGLGIICLLGSIEFAFPTIRPLYYWYRGKQQLAARPKTALISFLDAINLQPNHALAWEGKGDALYSLEKFPAALEAYQQATKLDTKREQIWNKQGSTLFRLEKFSAALEAYQRSSEIEPQNREALVGKGKTLQSLKRYSEALEIQESVLNNDPLNPELLSDRGHSLMGLSRYYDALGVFNRVQAIAPRDPQLWQDKAISLYELNRPQEAQRVIGEVIDTYNLLAKEQPPSFQNLVAQGDFLNRVLSLVSPRTNSSDLARQAEISYQTAASLKPDGYEAWLGQGRLAYTENRYDDALASITQALQLQGESPLAWYTRGLILQNGKSQPMEALQAYEKSIEFEPALPEAWYSRGSVLAEQLRYNDAIESFKQSLRLDPQNTQAWLDLSNSYLKIDRSDLAIGTIDRALAFKPQELEVWQQKGTILTALGQYSEACDAYRQSRQIDPNYTPILEAMEQLGCRLNKVD